MAAAVQTNYRFESPPSFSSSRTATFDVPPHGLTYPDWLRTWSDDDVARWLTDNRCGTYAQAFRENDIRGDVLLDLDQQSLKEMNVSSVGDRIKIIVAIKKLRQACVTSSAVKRANASIPLSASQSSLRSQSSTSSLKNANAQQQPLDTTNIKRSGSLRGAQRIPPPLDLNNFRSNAARPANNAAQTTINLPARNVHLNGLASGNSHGSNSSGASLLSAPSNQLSLSPSPTSPLPGHMRHSSALRQPPSHPAPKASLPAPPEHISRARSSSTNQSVDLGRPSTAPSHTANIPLAAGTRSTKYPTPYNSSPQQQQTSKQNPLKPGAVPLTHRKTGSLAASAPASSYQPGPSRPSTANPANTVYGHHQPLSQHPYATNTSPTFEATLGSTSRPSVAKGANQPLSLSPINETISHDHPRAVNVASHRNDVGFIVGKGGFARPTTPAGTVSATASGLVNSPVPGSVPLEDLLRRTVKFVSEDGLSKLVNVENARDTDDIMYRVLKKFGKLSSGVMLQHVSRYGEVDGDAYVEMDGWGIFITQGDGSARALTDNELLSICTQVQRPERQRGLILRKLHYADDMRSSKRPRNKLRDFFGEDLPSSDTRGTTGLISPTSPTHMLDARVPATLVEPASPTPSSPSSDDFAAEEADYDARPTSARKRAINRASTVSVMSGLLDWTNGQPPSAKTSPSPGGLLGKGARLRSFFGHRPPSELIQGHLADYFPSAEKKLLNKTARNSFRKSIARPKSQYTNTWESTLPAPDTSRFSISSAGSNRTSRSLEPPPPLPDKEAREHYAPAPLNSLRKSEVSIRASMEEAILEEEDGSQEMPSSADEEADGVRPPSRVSIGSRKTSSRLSIRTSKSTKDSDLASLLTLDEITAEVETRRMSMASTWDVKRALASDSSASDEALWSEGSPSQSDKDEESGESEDEEEEEADESPSKVTSTGAKNQIKWIKGALIGSGSFGQVYLAMNAMNGTLMAVKQVEIPTDDSHNASRKKSMLDALEREIELLKGLQHEHIVEYLDSSSDGVHLNIFLEYVPGGSVAALLKNYGAFEEPLVKTFVRQIVQGLSYLHERDIIHRDIKGANILVDNKGTIKISDFGISKRVEDNLLSNVKVHRPSLQGSVFWMAPEVVKQTSYTSKADIWSLGCVTVEMLTGDHPYIKLNQMQALFKIGSGTTCPELPADITHDAQLFLKSTFALDYKARPSASDLLVSLFLGDAQTQATPTASSFPR